MTSSASAPGRFVHQGQPLLGPSTISAVPGASALHAVAAITLTLLSAGGEAADDMLRADQ